VDVAPGFTAGCTEDVFPTIGRSWSCLIEKEIWLAERRWRDEQQRAASERKRAEAAAVAEREAAIAAAQEREKAQREFRERSDRDARRHQREREIADLRLRAARQEAWQRSTETAARNAVVQRQRQVVIDVLDRIVNLPPAPEPVTEVVYVSEE